MPTPNRHDRVIATLLAYLATIRDETSDLSALLVGLDHLPPDLAADAARQLGRTAAELAVLTEQIGRSGPTA
jgi:hypothetical protein